MKNKILTILLALLFILLTTMTSSAEFVTKDEVQQVAANWIALKIDQNGNWGGANTAEVNKIIKIERSGHLLGYYCEVYPHGFIAVSAVKGVAPVKAYSDKSRLDVTSDEGSSDLLKCLMHRVIVALENEYGSLNSISSDQIADIIRIDYQTHWALLNQDGSSFLTELESVKGNYNYDPDTYLLSSYWHQGEPYYNYIPPDPEPLPFWECTRPHCSVGCVGLAGAMIAHYWSRPTGRPWYDMPDTLTTASTTQQIEATAQYCRHIADEVETVYCGSNNNPCGSSATTADLEDYFEAWGFQDCENSARIEAYQEPYQFDSAIVYDLELNRPIAYRVEGHAIVCDGYSNVPYRQYHMNYGHADSSENIWYTLDNLDLGNPDLEYMVHNIRPTGSIGGVLFPDIEYPPFSFHYIVMNCYTSGNTIIQTGNSLQFLTGTNGRPGPYLKCFSGSLRILGSAQIPTSLYAYEFEHGVKIHNGVMKMHPGGMIRFYNFRPQ